MTKEKQKVCIITLGCKVNQYESEALSEVLSQNGFKVSHKLEKADIFILNSCAVTNEAEKKSRQTLAKFNSLNPKCKIFVCGCASQNNPEQFEKIDNVKYIIGNSKILTLLDCLNKKGKKIWKFPENYEDLSISHATNTRAYVKIQDGCNRYCSYCLIPYLRGKSRSRDIISILKEIDTLIKNGAKEIVLTGVDISDYQIDEKPALLELLQEIDKFGVPFRLGSIEPNLLTLEFINELKKLSNFCPHFHISMQSGSTSVLARMNRHYSAKFFIERTEMLKKVFKNCGITTDIIVGFPGETDAEFAETLETINQIKFSHMHIFPYSRRSGTTADKLLTLKSNKEFFAVDGKITKKRVQKLLELNAKFEDEFLKKQLHKKLKIVVEEKVNISKIKDEKLLKLLSKKPNYSLFSATSANYVKVYIISKKQLENTIQTAKIIKVLDDGVLGKV